MFTPVGAFLSGIPFCKLLQMCPQLPLARVGSLGHSEMQGRLGKWILGYFSFCCGSGLSVWDIQQKWLLGRLTVLSLSNHAGFYCRSHKTLQLL